MGSCFIDMTYPKCTRDQLEKKHSETCDRAAIESGRSYSGDWGSKTRLYFPQGDRIVGAGVIAALTESNDKWGPAFAVRRGIPSKAETRDIDAARQRMKLATERFVELFNGAFVGFKGTPLAPGSVVMFDTRSALEEAINRESKDLSSVEVWGRIFREVQSKVRGCACCGSSLSLNGMRKRFDDRKQLSCPLCLSTTGMLSAGDEAKQAKLLEKRKGALLEVFDLHTKVSQAAAFTPTQNSDWEWYVGGWAPS